VGRDLSFGGLAGLRLLDVTKGEESTEFLVVVISGEVIDASYYKTSSVSLDWLSWVNLVACQIVISDLCMPRLPDSKRIRELPALKQLCERVPAVIGVVHFPDLNGVVSKVVVDDEWQVIPAGVEAEHMAVVVEELLLAAHTASPQ